MNEKLRHVRAYRPVCKQRRFWVVAAVAAFTAAAWLAGFRAAGGIGLAWIAYRLYKLVGRRCNCGHLLVMRVSKIQLAPDETISVRIKKGGKYRFRWWIRRVRTVTFSVCECGWVEVVKTSKGPISIAHAWWVRLTDREQFCDDPELTPEFNKHMSDSRKRDFLMQHPEQDTPPVPVFSWLRRKLSGPSSKK